MADQGPADPGPVREISNWALWQKLVSIEGDVRSYSQTQREVVLPTLKDQGKKIRGLEWRFYGVLAGLISAIVVLASIVNNQ